MVCRRTVAGQWQQRPSCLGDDIGVTEAGRPMWPAPSRWVEPGWEPWVWGPASRLTGIVLACVHDPCSWRPTRGHVPITWET